MYIPYLFARHTNLRLYYINILFKSNYELHFSTKTGVKLLSSNSANKQKILFKSKIIFQIVK